MEMVKQEKKTNILVKEITITAMFIALTLVFTYCVQIRLPIAANGGLIHLGNVPLFIAAIVYGKRTGALAGAIGMGLFDVLSGWAAWAPCTIIVVGLMGFFVGFICEKKKTYLFRVIAIVVALFIKLAGYYIFEAIFISSPKAALVSIPGNVIQVGLAAILVLLIIQPLERGLKQAN